MRFCWCGCIKEVELSVASRPRHHPRVGQEEREVFDAREINKDLPKTGWIANLARRWAAITAKPDSALYLAPQEFNQIYAGYRDQILGYCYKMVRNWQDAENVTAEVFLKLWDKPWMEYPNKPLIYRIATNSCIDVLRRNGNAQVGYLDDQMDLPDQQATQPDELVLRTERQMEVVRAIAQLPLGHRTIIVLAFYQGLSNGEIGQVLELTEGTVKNKRSQAYDMLRGILDFGG